LRFSRRQVRPRLCVARIIRATRTITTGTATAIVIGAVKQDT